MTSFKGTVLKCLLLVAVLGAAGSASAGIPLDSGIFLAEIETITVPDGGSVAGVFALALAGLGLMARRRSAK